MRKKKISKTASSHNNVTVYTPFAQSPWRTTTVPVFFVVRFFFSSREYNSLKSQSKRAIELCAYANLNVFFFSFLFRTNPFYVTEPVSFTKKKKKKIAKNTTFSIMLYILSIYASIFDIKMIEWIIIWG